VYFTRFASKHFLKDAVAQMADEFAAAAK